MPGTAAGTAADTAAGTPEVVTAGEAMLLLLAEPGIPFVQATTFRRSVAGAESNVAIGLARLGHTVEWLGLVGDDPAGQVLLRLLRAEGVGTSHVRVEARAPTGLLLRDSHPHRAIEVQYARAGSAATLMAPEHVETRLLHGVRLLHVTGITAMLSESCHRTVLQLLELADRHGVPVSLDPNIRTKIGGLERWREVVGPLLLRAELVFAGEDELAGLTGRPAGDAVAELLDAGVGTVVVKGVDRSATVRTGTEMERRPAFAVPAVDPVGAGDALAAGYLSAWLRGLPMDRALAEAVTVAALAVQCPNDIDGLPDAAGRDRALAAFVSAVQPVHR